GLVPFGQDSRQPRVSGLAWRRSPICRVPPTPFISGQALIIGRSLFFGIWEPELASYQEISAFLAEVERRAYKQALFAVRDEDAALDIVQEAMLKLTEKYAANPVSELQIGRASCRERVDAPDRHEVGTGR